MCLRACESGDGDETLVCGFDGGCVAVFQFESSSSDKEIKSSVISMADDPTKVLPIITLDFDLAFFRGVCGSPGDHLCFFNYDPVTCELRWEANGEKPLATKLRAPGASCVKIWNSCSKGIEKSRSMLVVGTLDHAVNVYSWPSEGKSKIWARCDFHKDTIESVAFSRGKIAAWGCDKEIFAACSMDGNISLYYLYE
jgi:hypothetical protein